MPQRTLASVEPLSGARFLKSDTVMKLLGYSDRSSFWRAVRISGIPFVRINPHRVLFEESAIRAFIDSRTVGKAA